MLPLVLIPISLFTLAARAEELKATFTLGNSSASLAARDLFTRQYTCADEGYGICDSGQCCPLDGGCCGSYNCAQAGEACCGTEGYVYPLDGSACCSDGSHCDPGYECYECVDYPSAVCCYDPGAVASYSQKVEDVYASYTAAVESANDHNSAVWSSYTAAVSSAISSYNGAWSSYDAAWSSYDVAVSSYIASGDSYQYQYYYSTYYYYIIIWYTTTLIARPTLTSSSSSTSTVLSAYCTASAEAQLSWSAQAQTLEAQVSEQAVYSSQAASGDLAIETMGLSFSASASDGAVGGGSGGGSNGAGSLAGAREGWAVLVLPAVGMAVGVLAVAL